MIVCIRCEAMKCRGSLLWPALFLIPLIPVVLGTGNYLANLDILRSGWYSLWTQISLFYSNFFFAPLIGVYCAFFWRYENFHSCRNALFTAPVSYGTIYLGKYLMVCAVTLFSQLWLAFLYLAAGILAGLPGLPPASIVLWILRGTAGGFVAAAIQFILACVFRSFALPVVLGVLGGFTGLLAAGRSWGIFWPYALMLLGMNANRTEDMLDGGIPLFLAVTLIYLVLINLAGVRIMKRTAVL